MASIDIELEGHVPTEDERVVQWRLEGLERAGYGGTAALELALAPYVDLHQAAELVRCGCAPDLALQILL